MTESQVSVTVPITIRSHTEFARTGTVVTAPASGSPGRLICTPSVLLVSVPVSSPLPNRDRFLIKS